MHRVTWSLLCGGLVLGMVSGATPAWAQTVVYVDGAATGAGNGTSWADAFTTVRAGLNAAQSGNQVWVKAGRYVGIITLKLGVGLYGGFAGTEDPAMFDLSDRDFVANETILEMGTYSGSVVTLPSGATATCRVDGFTITNGHGTYLGADTWAGGGLYLLGSPTVANNKITGNSGGDYGGGLYGGGTIVNNTITRNVSVCGAGVFVSSATVANNTIAGNSANIGAGLYVTGNATIVNNTIVCNSADPSYVGGICLTQNAAPTIANNLVAFNSSGVDKFTGGGTPTWRYNCVFGNRLYNFSGLADPTGTNGNISADPLFAQVSPGPDGLWGTPDDTYGDLRLVAGSPCIDAGDNGAVPPDTPDLDGDGDTTEPLPFDVGGRPRFADDPNTPDTGAGSPPIVDMGAYEFYQHGDLNCDGLVNAQDIDGFVLALFDEAFDFEHYHAQYPHCDPGAADMNADGHVNGQDIDAFVAALFVP